MRMLQIFVFVVLGGGGSLLSAPTIDPNQFAQAYNDWIKLYSQHDSRVYDVREVRLWEKVKTEFHRLEKQIDKQYDPIQ